MIEIVPFKVQHAIEISSDIFIDVLMAYEKAQTSFTAIKDGEILCCGGIIIAWHGMGSVWTVNSPLVKKYPLMFHKLIRRWLKYFINTHGLQRVQALVDPNNYTNIRWIEALGFEREGILRKYRDDKDYCIYALIGG